jgi:hypothetical protein
MKERTIKQYTCDFCKKKYLSKSAMATHEKHCTKNPGRICRMCDLLGDSGSDLPTLVAILKSVPFCSETELGPYYNEDIIESVMPKLREAANHCPMCILAAIRQAGIPARTVGSFDFKKEKEEAFDTINEDKAQGYYYRD